ncbi:twin-arginine translocation pathway signal protein [Marinobacter vulgaris]|uniref:Twin-arginine translocation pathway signal protein n=1 Tax=Marinobacter vulgaris TaxID=1928331 RepID=A0A2V3ZVM6_9GAMM|nr:YHS domain-containing (seleno)protein [Marinobacter vulgaris]PXX89552.1 twin-arginine translocation pathway signal protein [Marinobacter vulgaris]TSJ68542.1 YHS domain-containing protein [Marinobacter vulgaris]
MNRLLLVLIATALIFTTTAWASEPPVYTGLLSNTGAGGYDTVSYFETGKPTKGSSDFTTQWQGANWRFANAENLARFEANPERYAPAYGGYCAWAVSQGYLAKGDPKHWNIRNGRLYLNYNQSVQDKWLDDADGFIRQADANWPKVLD